MCTRALAFTWVSFKGNSRVGFGVDFTLLCNNIVVTPFGGARSYCIDGGPQVGLKLTSWLYITDTFFLGIPFGEGSKIYTGNRAHINFKLPGKWLLFTGLDTLIYESITLNMFALGLGYTF